MFKKVNLTNRTFLNIWLKAWNTKINIIFFQRKYKEHKNKLE